MRFLHTADWHIGKKLNDFDLLEDQQAVFEQLVETAEQHKVCLLYTSPSPRDTR